MGDVHTVILVLLKRRGPGKTICPSEAARVLAQDLAGEYGDWRAHMETVHTCVDALLKEGAITISWKGKQLGQRRGAYRITRRWPVE